jgi:hypothetical protein
VHFLIGGNNKMSWLGCPHLWVWNSVIEIGKSFESCIYLLHRPQSTFVSTKRKKVSLTQNNQRPKLQTCKEIDKKLLFSKWVPIMSAWSYHKQSLWRQLSKNFFPSAYYLPELESNRWSCNEKWSALSTLLRLLAGIF